MENVDIFCGRLVYFMAIWWVFSHFDIMYQEKSCDQVDIESKIKPSPEMNLAVRFQTCCRADPWVPTWLWVESLGTVLSRPTGCRSSPETSSGSQNKETR
jgi:hypothetical protein